MGARDLASTLFGKTRRAVLALTYGHPDESFHLRRIARFASSGMGVVQRELKQLTDAGILSRTVSGRQVYYQAASGCPIFAELSGVVTKTAGVADVLRDCLGVLQDRIVAAFVYGSVAGAGARRDSDVNLLVIGDVSFGEVVDSLAHGQQRIGREINPVVYGLREARKKLREKSHFLTRVMAGPKVFLIGDDRELERLRRSHPKLLGLALPPHRSKA